MPNKEKLKCDNCNKEANYEVEFLIRDLKTRKEETLEISLACKKCVDEFYC